MLRYDRKSTGGYYGLTQQSIHLVTAKYSEVATAPYNLNFIFSDENSLQSQQDHLYTTLPFLCDYFRLLTLVVLDKVSTFNTEHSTWWIDEARRIAGLELLKPSSKPSSPKGEAVSFILSSHGPKCPKCENTVDSRSEIAENLLHSFMYEGKFTCLRCNEKFWAYPESSEPA